MLEFVYNFQHAFLGRYIDGITLAILRQWGKVPSLTDSFIIDARVGEMMSAMCLMAKLGTEFNKDFFDKKPLIILLTSIEIGSRKKCRRHQRNVCATIVTYVPPS